MELDTSKMNDQSQKLAMDTNIFRKIILSNA